METQPMSEYEYCLSERDGHLLIVTLNRPAVMNALHRPAHEELAQVFDRFRDDPDLWVAIVTGAGERAFCAGNDLKYQAQGNALGWPPSGFAGLTHREDIDKPIIAAVNGVAMGGGFEIALACDLIVAAERARFALPEPRVGLAALAGGIPRLARMIPEKHALGMMLTGRHVGATEGAALGFVNEVVPDGELMAAARRWAAQIMACSPMSIRATKAAFYAGLYEDSLAGALRYDYPAVKAMYDSEDYIEGPKAFAEKREPKWSGR
jgi:crotonobetainyl-CoA hydratase